jgi:hypothetical protein
MPETKAKQGFRHGAGLAWRGAMPASASMQLAANTQAMRQAAVASAAAAPAAQSQGGFSLKTAFHDLLDIVNPLQHLPVVGTLYRAITGDKIGTVEKIAGDALYGGLWGAVGSVADTAFEAVTGKDFGSTVLAFAEKELGIGQQGASVQVATTPAAAPAAASATDGADVLAFGNALASKGVDNALASRAMYAYRKSQGTAVAAAALN